MGEILARGIVVNALVWFIVLVTFALFAPAD